MCRVAANSVKTLEKEKMDSLILNRIYYISTYDFVFECTWDKTLRMGYTSMELSAQNILTLGVITA